MTDDEVELLRQERQLATDRLALRRYFRNLRDIFVSGRWQLRYPTWADFLDCYFDPDELPPGRDTKLKLHRPA